MASGSLRLAALVCTFVSFAACTPFGGEESSPTPDEVAPASPSEAPAGIEPAPVAAKIALVQQTASSVASTKTATIGLAKPLASGDLVVVAVGWFDASASITDVRDEVGNAYRPVSSQTSVVTSETEFRQQIWYAPGVTAGGATLSVTWDRAATHPDMRVAEFAGLDRATPLTAAKVSRSSNTFDLAGDVEVTRGPSLVFAGMTMEGLAQRGGADVQYLISPEGNQAAWRIVDAPGTYSVTALQAKEPSDGPSLDAITEVVAFR